MPHSLTSLFMTLMTDDDLSVALQQRIFAHGRRHGDTSLLARLASHVALDADIDALLKEENAAPVRCAWISRPGRSIDEIGDILDKEKRATILTALAEQPSLPDHIARTLIDRTKNTNVLLTMVQAAHLSIETRTAAADRIVAHLGDIEPSDEGIPSKKVAALKTVGEHIDGYMKAAVVNTPNMYVLRAAVDQIPLDPDSQRAFVTQYLTMFEAQLKQAPKTRYESANGAQADLNLIVGSLCETSQIPDDVRVTLEKVCMDLKSLYPKESWAQNQLERSISSLKNAKAANFDAIREEFDAITSTEGISAFIKKIDKKISAGELSYRHPVLSNLAAKISLSPLGTAEQIKLLEDWFMWSATAPLIARVDSTEKQIALIECGSFYSTDYGDVIASAPNASALLEALIAHGVENNDRWLLSNLVELKQFSGTHLRRIPLSILAQMDLTAAHRATLQQILADDTIADETWATIETLSEEFEGSIEQLFELAAAI